MKNVLFIENYQKVLPVLKKNLSNLKNIENYEILEKDIYDVNTFENLNDKFEIIFLDPPYKDKNLKLLLNRIIFNNLLNKKGIIIIHRHKNERELFPNNFKILEEKKYGISKILFLTYIN